MTFIFLIAFLGLIYAFSKNIFDSNFSSTKSPGNASQNTGFELFTNSGQSTLTNNEKIVSVRILNLKSDEFAVQKIKDKLLENGYLIEKTIKEEAEENGIQIIYQEGFQTEAEKIKTEISELNAAQIGIAQTVDKSYDILIKIGNLNQ